MECLPFIYKNLILKAFGLKFQTATPNQISGNAIGKISIAYGVNLIEVFWYFIYNS